MKNSIILQEKENQQAVSSSDSTEIYTIEKTNTTCSCELKCVKCNACIHKYYCTCTDSAIKWNICKHVHFLLQNFKFDLNQDIIVNVDKKAESAEFFNHIASSSTNNEANFEKRQTKTLETFKLIFNNATTTEALKIIDKALKAVPAVMTAWQQSKTSRKTKFDTVASETGNKKIIPQRKFISTKKRRSCKRFRSKWSSITSEIKNKIAANLILSGYNISPERTRFDEV